MSDIVTDTTLLLSLGDGGLRPSDAEIAMSPVISDWYLADDPLFYNRVIGTVTGHPTIDDGYISATPPRFADLDRGWVRTQNTLYRLGRHKGDRDE